jgi:hypothetical protein
MTKYHRELVIGATAAVAAAGSLPSPAIAHGVKELKMVTSWIIELQPRWVRVRIAWRSRLLQCQAAGSM